MQRYIVPFVAIVNSKRTYFMKEVNDNKACSLELSGGYHGHPYPQKFVRAPKSQYPSTPVHAGKETPHNEAMKITLKG